MRRNARKLLRNIVQETGALTFVEKIQGCVAVLLSVWTWFTLKMNLFQQPRLLRLEYDPAKTDGRASEEYAAELKPQTLPAVSADE